MTSEVASEAAVWVARLHGPDRTKAMERECLAWQARSAAHRLAFERCTDTWQDVAGLTLSAYAAATRLPAPGKPGARCSSRRAALTSALLASIAMFAWRPWAHEQVFETGIGEQRVVLLADGTRMTLNTATSVRVSLMNSRRMVSLQHGEALFEVAKDPGRPFVVQVADANVVATGTSFLVRSALDGPVNTDAFGVTLIEGQVIVQRAGSLALSSLTSPVVMAPGERLRVARREGGQNGAASRLRLDRPEVSQLVAWKRGEVVFGDVPLLDAVAEMNRYSKMPIELEDPESLSALRVSGVFKTGDGTAFARALARLHGLTVRERGTAVVLALKLPVGR
ncbi:MAG: FecR domain-containing protein [Burkholderiales bacterium]|nr:FecR domain-containing protein [Burkholderiales bacterium]